MMYHAHTHAPGTPGMLSVAGIGRGGSKTDKTHAPTRTERIRKNWMLPSKSQNAQTGKQIGKKAVMSIQNASEPSI
jgi:hypothetical protein